jgi:polygalacturonase
MYCGDDCIAIKAKSHNREFSRNTERITVRRSLCISACAALKIGTETVADSIRDVLFEDNDIIFARRALVIDALDRSRIGGVTFRDIRIETLNDGPGIHRPRLIEFQISSEAFRPCEGTCSIADVLVENVSSGSLYPSRIIGRTQEHGIRRVTIRALTIQGRSITNSADAALETNEFVAELVFEQA